MLVQSGVWPCRLQCQSDPCSSIQLLLRFFTIILTASSSNPWVFIPAVVVMTALLALRWYYLKTSRDVKRLEAIGDYADMSELEYMWWKYTLVMHCVVICKKVLHLLQLLWMWFHSLTSFGMRDVK